MCTTSLSFDMRSAPFGTSRATLYDAALDMVAYAEESGIANVIFSEHHASPDGYIPAPTPLAAPGARTRRIAITLGRSSCHSTTRSKSPSRSSRRDRAGVCRMPRTRAAGGTGYDDRHGRPRLGRCQTRLGGRQTLCSSSDAGLRFDQQRRRRFSLAHVRFDIEDLARRSSWKAGRIDFACDQCPKEAIWRFFAGLVRQLKRSPVDAERRPGVQVEHDFYGLVGIGMLVRHEPTWGVGADRQQCEIRGAVALSHRTKYGTVTISGVACEIREACARSQHEATPKGHSPIAGTSGRPMIGRHDMRLAAAVQCDAVAPVTRCDAHIGNGIPQDRIVPEWGYDERAMFGMQTS